MHTENTLKHNLKSQQTTKASWLIARIKAILKTPIQKSEKPIFSFRITHEAVFRDSKILAEFKDDLGAEIAAQKDIPLNYGSELRNTSDLAQLFLYHEDSTKPTRSLRLSLLYIRSRRLD